jgi:hypothetical protein
VDKGKLEVTTTAKGRGLIPPHHGSTKGEHKMEATEYTYNELTGQWERVERTDIVEDTYTEGRDFDGFEL